MTIDNYAVIFGFIGLILSPIISLIGVMLSERRQKKRDEDIALKEKREAEAKENELQLLMNKAAGDALASYGSIIESLRTQSDMNSQKISELITKLQLVTVEKERLALENTKLLEHVKEQDAKIHEQSLEIAELRSKISALENKKE